MRIDIRLAARWAVVVAAMGYFVDLFDAFLIPALRVPMLRDLGVSDAESLAVYAMVFNWQLAGMFLGALFLWGPLADLRGRRSIMLGSILVYGCGSLLTAFVQDVGQLTIIRFLTGIGLGGELGAGIALVAESMEKTERGKGTMLVGFVGMFGVVAASLLANTGLDWRTIFVLGGLLAFAVLTVRLGVTESPLFLRRTMNRHTSGSYLTTIHRLIQPRNFVRLTACVLVGAPTFFVAGLVVPGAPEFGSAFGMTVAPSPATALIWTYSSIALGDFLCGMLAQLCRSRKLALLIFHLITLSGIGLLVLTPPETPEAFYFRCSIAGLGVGLWANMVTNAAEQFGTDLRGTVTVVVPTAVRLLLFPISAAFLSLKPALGFVGSAALVGILSSLIAIAAVLFLRDGFSRDLNFETTPSRKDEVVSSSESHNLFTTNVRNDDTTVK